MIPGQSFYPFVAKTASKNTHNTLIYYNYILIYCLYRLSYYPRYRRVFSYKYYKFYVFFLKIDLFINPPDLNRALNSLNGLFLKATRHLKHISRD